MPFFDDCDRSGHEPANHLVGEFDYLNASGRTEAGRVRALLEQWLTHYPELSREDLVRRFRSRDDTQHRGAFFELFLHELVRGSGLCVNAIEPTLPNGRAPDFLIQTNTQTEFYLEATLATGLTRADAGAQRRLREALQAIDDVDSPFFFLHLNSEGLPSAPVAVRRLRQAVQRFVDGLDYGAARAAFEAGNETSQAFRHEEHGLVISIQAIPKNTPQGGGRAIGGHMLAGGLIEPHVAIKSAVQHKAGHYGELDRPLIIAVNGLEEYAGIDDALNAMFGTEAVAVSSNGQHRWVRNPDGAWHDARGPIHTRCSAILFTNRLSPWSLGQRSAHLILNPWARNPIDLPASGFDVRRIVENRLVLERGRSLQELLGIAPGWPEVD